MSMLAAVQPQDDVVRQGVSVHDGPQTDFDSSDDLPAFALPPKTAPMERSFRRVRVSSRSRTQQPLQRTLSQKRKLQHVCFRDDNLAEVKTVEKIPNEAKNDVWYASAEMYDLLGEEMDRNIQTFLLHGPSYRLENSNLTWRGLEEHIPSPADNDHDRFSGHARRMEKIQAYSMLVLGVAGAVKGEENGYVDIAERATLLSQMHREEAIERAQKDAVEAAKEDVRVVSSAECLEPSDDCNASMIKAFVAWFCSAP